MRARGHRHVQAPRTVVGSYGARTRTASEGEGISWEPADRLWVDLYPERGPGDAVGTKTRIGEALIRPSAGRAVESLENGPFGERDWARDRRYGTRSIRPRTGTAVGWELSMFARDREAWSARGMETATFRDERGCLRTRLRIGIGGPNFFWLS